MISFFPQLCSDLIILKNHQLSEKKKIMKMYVKTNPESILNVERCMNNSILCTFTLNRH